MSVNVRRDRGYARKSKKYDNNSGDQNKYSKSKDEPDEEKSTYHDYFRELQVELDTRHDKYEAIVKKSRDVTIESKRVIFLLHRITGQENKDNIMAEAESRLEDLSVSFFKDIALELEQEDHYLYLRAYSPGLQEFIEALSFYHYVTDGSLIPHSKIVSLLTFNIKPQENDQDPLSSSVEERTLYVNVPPVEYVLGIADLTGELMRKCINSISSGDLEEPFRLCIFIRQIHEAFLSFGNTISREVSRKGYVLKQSLQKVENVCYTLQMRGQEIPKHMLVDALQFQTVIPHYNEESENINDD